MSKYIKLEDAFEAVEQDNFYTIENLKNLPTIEVSEDCISKASVIYALSLYRKTIETELTSKVSVIADIVLGTIDDCIKLVGKAPSVVPKRAEGEWICNTSEVAGEGYYICSNCKRDEYNATDYCPNCGAKMKGADDVLEGYII